MYDGFLRSDQSFPDPSRPSTTPFAITIKDHCFVDVSCFPILLYWRILKYYMLLLQVEEFCKVVYVRHLKAFDKLGFLIVWDWLLNDGNCDDDTDSSVCDRISSEEFASQEEDTQESCVPFKCIGVTRDTEYQNILRKVKDIIKSAW